MTEPDKSKSSPGVSSNSPVHVIMTMRAFASYVMLKKFLAFVTGFMLGATLVMLYINM